MTRWFLVAATLVLGVTAALAQADVIKQRQDQMKSNGAATRTGTQLVRGDTPFDLARAKEVFANYERVGKVYGTLFPENSKTGGDTRAAPRIWEDMAGYQAATAKFATDAARASAATTDLESFKTNFAAVTQNCSSCHERYRINRS